MRETVVKFDDADVLGTDAGRFVDLPGGASGHVVADKLHHVAGIEGRGLVRYHRLCGNADARHDALALGELRRNENGRGCATGRRAGHGARHHAGPDHLLAKHILFAHFLAEDRERIVHGVTARLVADLGKILHGRAIFQHVRKPRSAEISEGSGNSISTSASVTVSKSMKGLGRSVKVAPRAPGVICSKPTAIAQSAAPLAMAWR